MPQKALSPCRHRGCPEVVRGGGYCPEHKPKRTTNRPYSTARWQRTRAEFLQINPFCCECGRLATDVDHIVPHKGNAQLMYSWENLQSLCHSCHAKKTAKHDGAFGKRCYQGIYDEGGRVKSSKGISK